MHDADGELTPAVSPTGKRTSAARSALGAVPACVVEGEPEGDWVSLAAAARALFGGGSHAARLRALLDERHAPVKDGRARYREALVPCCEREAALAVDASLVADGKRRRVSSWA